MPQHLIDGLRGKSAQTLSGRSSQFLYVEMPARGQHLKNFQAGAGHAQPDVAELLDGVLAPVHYRFACHLSAVW
ncbi:hypothetical protein ABZ214_33460 [Streptomyces iakyrus]|uniref:hypothetical protein n=1 Tax=Streptomyces iakyrus TaxID=68219 RepID=UPI00339FAA16